MTKSRRNRSRSQRALRRRRGERAFLFDEDLSRCLGEVARDEWEIAISICGGDVSLAARECGLTDIPRGSKALWGRSALWGRTTTEASEALWDSSALWGRTDLADIAEESALWGRESGTVFSLGGSLTTGDVSIMIDGEE